MDYKLDYITRLFYKIKNKKTESYVINRIWHQLNNNDVKFVIQQYIKRTNDKYALADLYLPQINMFIEINEPFHKGNIEIDNIRNEEIINITKAIVEVIDCDNPIEKIHEQISDVVKLIEEKVKVIGDKFRPWEGENSLSVDYHQKKGYLLVDDNEYVRTIDDAFAIFNATAKHKGFLRVAGANIPNKENEIVWCPNGAHNTWTNKLSDDFMVIREYYGHDKEDSLIHKNEEQKRSDHVKEHTSNPKTRVTFYRGKDDLGFNFYRFVGVFEIDKEQSLKENKCVWVQISDRYDL